MPNHKTKEKSNMNFIFVHGYKTQNQRVVLTEVLGWSDL